MPDAGKQNYDPEDQEARGESHGCFRRQAPSRADMNDRRKERILVVEDEALVARELQSRLTQMGWEVVGIAYGEEAVELARETRPDLLLTDIHLKNGIDGIDVAREICEEQDMPVVFLTAYSDDETVSRAKAVTPFGYIIKPVENRDLQITIDMELYKFRIDQELKETQQLLQTALACIGSALLFVNDRGEITEANSDARKLLGKKTIPELPWYQILGQERDSMIYSSVSSALEDKGISRLPPFVVELGPQEMKLVDGIVGPMDKGGVLILRELADIKDTVEMLGSVDSDLPDRRFELIPSTESSMVQILMAPDRIAAGDAEKVIRRISGQIAQYVRATDLVSVLGGSILSVNMPYTTVVEGERIAETLLQEVTSELRAGEEFGFSIGLACSVAGDRQPLELFRRARLALDSAQSSGGGRVVVWNKGFEPTAASRSSEFQIERDYQNLVLMWNIMNVLSRAQDLHDLARGFCEHLFQFFRFQRVALLSRENGSLSAVAGYVEGTGEVDSIAELGLSALEFRQLDELFTDSEGRVRDGERGLYPVGSGRVLLVDSTGQDTPVQEDFLKTLVAYFSAGVARFDLPPAQAPVRNTSSLSGFVFRSPQLQSIVESIQLVAPTDATVLIAGESGTGKEMLARYVHEQSLRRDKPFIIVDCGAVVGSLIESELFGHVRGAFTGADRNFTGRLQEADGGTVLLDEIGELPLDVQVKLLRFVQNREIAAVGSTDYRTVDTRVIAATNKNLQKMVEEGTFREDLFHRLNVFAITTPLLRERPDDILPLADHYLEYYASHYGKDGLEFSPEATEALLQHDWPGNVRELVNVINRAVILCKDSRLNPIHLGLFSHSQTEDGVRPSGIRPSGVRPSGGRNVHPVSLRKKLAELVDRSLLMKPALPPIGVWIEEDLILARLQDHGEILNRAALSLGIPETTLRRKVNRLKETWGGKSPDRPGGWIDIRTDLGDLDEVARSRNLPLLELVTRSLVREIESRNLPRQDAARLMGVSVPTYRKLLEETS